VVVHDDSMLPVLQPGDRLLVDRRAYRDRPPAVGDIVVLVDPEMPQRWLVKRVAAVGPGRFRKTATGLTPAASELASNESPAPEAFVLAEGTVYVTGDATGSRDSQVFGPVSFGAIVGRAYRRYAPTGRERDL
jgi:signal peptidase I